MRSVLALSVTVRSTRNTDDGRIFYRVTEAAMPTLRVVPNPRVAQFARDHGLRYVFWSDEFGSSPPEGLGDPAFSEPGVRIWVLT